MQIDLEQHAARTEPFHAKVCIVGAGIAGLILAQRLAALGIDVALLEAGGHTLEDRSQIIYNARMAARTHTGTHEGRFRTLGGSSTRWGGQILPYTADIFQPPSLLSHSWPITAEEIAPFYPAAQSILGADALPFEASAFFDELHLPTPLLQSALSEIDVRFSKWAPFSRRNLANTVARDLLPPNAGRVTVYLHANVTEHLLAPDGSRIEAALVRNYAGARFRFQADHFVLAAGTIESSRLLLASRSVAPSGVGNQYDQVGRYFHDHLSVPAATLTGAAHRQLLQGFAPFLLHGTTHTAKFEASPALRKRLDLLAVMAHIVIIEPEDSGAGVARALLQSLQRRDFGSALRKQLPRLPTASLDLLRLALAAKLKHRRFVSSRASVMLCIDSEQLPRPENRVRIDDELDALGLPRTVVDWNIAPIEVATLRTFASWLREGLAELQLGPIDWRSEFFDDISDLSGITDTYHPMGGLRMGNDPRASVVDTDLQVHGIGNLFIASAAVFPAGGSSNPTFTLMALTLRLAEHINAQLSR